MSSSLLAFTFWLSCFFAAGVAWSFIERGTEFGKWWLGINLVQLVITLAFAGLVKCFVNKTSNPDLYTVFFAIIFAVFYFLIFGLDLKKLMEIR